MVHILPQYIDSHSADQELSAFMEPEGSLPCTQQPTTGPSPGADASSPHLPTLFSKIHSNIIFPSTSRSSE